MKRLICVPLLLSSWGCDAPSDTPSDARAAVTDASADARVDAAVDAALDASLPLEGLRVEAVEGPPPDAYLVIASSGAGRVERLECGAGRAHEGALIRCAGWTLAPTPDAAWLTLKARGFEHLSVAADVEGPLRLEPLPPPARTEDYATSLEEMAAFEALAVPTQGELGGALTVKFYVEDLRGAEGPPTVYFQDTRRHPLHYDFYRRALGGAATRAEFEAATYAGEDRAALAGTLVAYPDLTLPYPAPITLNFFPSDALSPALALRAHQLIEARAPALALRGEADRLVYLPATATREAAAEEAAEAWVRADAPWAGQGALYGGLTQQLLNPGVAYGTLRVMEPEALEGAVVSARDLLLLPRLPNDLPLVGGTITEELQTPLAHVNVAARGRGTPNLALLDARAHPDVAPLIGALARLEVTGEGWSIRAATLEEAQAAWEAHAPEPFVPEADLEADGLLPFAEIGFEDAPRVGVKAANLAELRAALGEIAPDGFAVPFAYYERFIQGTTVTEAACDGAAEDCVEEGRGEAVCAAARAFCARGAGGEVIAEIIERLLEDPDLRADSVAREATLDALRWVMRHSPVDAAFAALLDGEVTARFGDARVRLRSSTNAEDLEGFSGAGLYKSVSADTRGGDDPSDEIRKVWASAWGWRAFEERAFWGIAHRAIKVGVAVHRASPDEAVNGVLITRNLADPTIAGYYVNAQLGEVSVTNPEGGATPEIFTITEGAGGAAIIRQRFSSLSPDAPLMSDVEVARLYLAARQAQMHFEPLYASLSPPLVLDMEFKLDGDTRQLLIKQARPYVTSSGASP